MVVPADDFRRSTSLLHVGGALRYAIEALVIMGLYFAVAKLSLRFASVNPSATPIWPPTGLALAVTILRGYRLWPAIFLAAFIANLTTAGTLLTSLTIAGGNTLEALVGSYLVNNWAGSRAVFARQIGVGKFALAAAAATTVSATVGVLTLCLAKLALWGDFGGVWITWWLGDLAGALVVAPAIILWATSLYTAPIRREALFLFLAATLAGAVAFTPLVPRSASRDALAFLVIVPLMWSALRWGQRETATVSLILSTFAALGTAAGAGPFANGTLNDSFLLVLIFMVSVTLPSLALSASIVTQRETESDTRHQAQRIVEETREQLVQAQKMEALGQLTGGIAHDFNNLLHVVGGYAQLLQVRAIDGQSQRALGAIRNAVMRGETLTRQLLSFARRQKHDLETLDLTERLGAVREMLRASLRGDIELAYDVQERVWPVKVDAAELEFALVNIAVNARDAMPDGGRLVISARNIALRGEVSGLFGDFVRLAIADTGDGIAPDLIGRIFEPFFTTKPVGKGTGLGLSQVYGFARQSGGMATADSSPGSGTTIALYLPRSHAEIAMAQSPEKALSLDGGQGRILVVEDNKDVSKLIGELFTQLGYDVEAVETASKALNRLKANPRPDLVFSDIVMPGPMNGYQLAKTIRVTFKDLPVLLTSGYNDVIETADCPFEVLPKPFDLATLDEAVRRALRRGSQA